ncbi:thioesterase [Polaribacter reichenbachii]|uniref:Thioesterase n=1 Tax=Polaribacter reichenbachii TaxID=996801 RepID=A0A1B8U5G3_9FLAO|nr:DUF4442 domain-containing protein [Polaribacter reichenbachii]APZ47549.1 thioesterase [Polaribacter reichenbachii]AUC18189.1 thioesterase [Polaribacter reichenbachii]OBY67098.1 thioesterase [Polaribacter reichenbachii]
MKFTPAKVNFFNLIKLPLAFFGGVRVKSITDSEVVVTIKHRWMNQNPFKSMFWAAQGMAAEMPTGILVMKAIYDSKRKVSMLVTHQEANFYKKATGRIVFTCSGGNEIREAIQKSIETGEGQLIVLTSIGRNTEGVEVSNFHFHWSIKVKSEA